MADKTQVVGHAQTISGAVTVKRAQGGQETLEKGEPVHQGDVVETGADGKVELSFVDSSKFALGPKGRMAVDDLTFDPAHPQDGHSQLSALQGPFSFVSGQIAKAAPEAMTIKTPVMQIGVRGTSGGGIAGAEGSQNTISLLRDPDGNLGQIVVSNAAGRVVLNLANHTIQVSSFVAAMDAPKVMPAAVLQQLFGGALDAHGTPPAPVENPSNTPSGPQQQGGAQGETPAPEAAAEAQQASLSQTIEGDQVFALMAEFADVLDPAEYDEMLSLLEEIGFWTVFEAESELDIFSEWAGIDLGGLDGFEFEELDFGFDEFGFYYDFDNFYLDNDWSHWVETIFGTEDADEIHGGVIDEHIYGLGGDDEIDGGGGYDYIFADDGDDVIEARDGYAVVFGGNGADTLSMAHATAGAVVDLGNGSFETDDGFEGEVYEVEIVEATSYADTLTGSTGIDSLYGNAGTDTLKGGGGADMLDLGVDTDRDFAVFAGTETDTATVANFKAGDILDLSAVTSQLDVAGAGVGIGGTITTSTTGDVTISGTSNNYTVAWDSDSNSSADFQVVLQTGSTIGNFYLTEEGYLFWGTVTTAGGSGADIVLDTAYGNTGANLSGGGGGDLMFGNGGDDTINGDADDDTIYAGTGADVVRGGTGNDTIHLGADSDLDKVFVTTGAGMGADLIKGFNAGFDQLALYNFTFHASTITSNAPQWQIVDSLSDATGSHEGLLLIDDGTDVEVYYCSDLSQADSSNSYQIATLAGVDASALGTANFQIYSGAS